MIGLKGFTFPSPLNRLTLDNVTIGEIESNATSALRIAHLTVSNSNISTIRSSAFSEFTHLDTFQMTDCRIENISSSAIMSATSNFTMQACHVGRMMTSALNMPAARVVLRENRIARLASGSLHLREWNDLLVENNTLEHVEWHAFYNIGESKVPISAGAHGEHDAAAARAVTVRFVVRQNQIVEADQGAFIFSPQAHQLQLEDNYFRRYCSCTLSTWTADLTQTSQRTETTSQTTSPDDQKPAEALWLGSSLLNTSYCWMAKDEAECLSMPEGYYYMANYTCPRRHETVECTNRFKARGGVYARQPGGSELPQSGADIVKNDNGDAKPIGFITSKQDIVLVIILAVVATIVLLSIFVGFGLSRRRSKSRQGDVAKGKSSSGDERITCSPLLPPGSEKSNIHLGSGVVSSGSISRLSVKEYRNYLDELGPIYSEPSDPPFISGSNPHQQPQQQQQPTSSLLVPPEIPAMPVEWTTKGRDAEGAKMTIDRGTQTFNSEEEKLPSLAQEFTDDVFAALKDTLDVSATYSEVKDNLIQIRNSETGADKKDAKDDDQDNNVVDYREIYDVIRVIDSSNNRPSTSSNKSEHIYCRPWNARDSASSESPQREAAFFGAPAVELATAEPTAVITDPVGIAASPASPAKERAPDSEAANENGKQPFYIRGSLPKWPPPAKSEVKSPVFANRNRSLSANNPPASPTKIGSLPPTNNGAGTGSGSPCKTKDAKGGGRSSTVTRPVNLNRMPSASRQGGSFAKRDDGGKTDGCKATRNGSTSFLSPTRSLGKETSQSTVSQVEPATEAACAAADGTTEMVNASNVPSGLSHPETTPAPSSNVVQLQQPIEDEYSEPRDRADSEYSEVSAAPFSFSFRRPLLQRPSQSVAIPPVKPARIASPTAVCDDYANPQDMADPTTIYAELPSN